MMPQHATGGHLLRAGFWLVLVAVGVIGFYGSIYLFSVPEACYCRALTNSDALPDVRILDNSVRDSNHIAVSLGAIDGNESLQICYSRRPVAGNTWSHAGLPDKGCEFE